MIIVWLWSAGLCDGVAVVREPHGEVLCEEQVQLGDWGRGINGCDGRLECLECARGLA